MQGEGDDDIEEMEDEDGEDELDLEYEFDDEDDDGNDYDLSWRKFLKFQNIIFVIVNVHVNLSLLILKARTSAYCIYRLEVPEQALDGIHVLLPCNVECTCT